MHRHQFQPPSNWFLYFCDCFWFLDLSKRHK